jgi:hypothetical protein
MIGPAIVMTGKASQKESPRSMEVPRYAYLPPLNVWLDLISTQYAICLITLSNNHGLYPVPKYQPALSSNPGIYRIMSFVSEYLSSPTRIKTRSFYNPINFYLFIYSSLLSLCNLRL